MRNRKRRQVVAGLAVGLIAVGAFIVWPRADRITPETAGRIREGMTAAEVEALLGPPGDYSTRPDADPVRHYWGYTDHFDDARWNWVRSAGGGVTHEWTGDTAIVCVYYRSGRVAGVDCFFYDPAEQTRLANLLWRARRQWRKWFA